MAELTQHTVVEKMREERFAMLTSMAPNGKLLSHPMMPQQVTDDADVWFFISRDADQMINLVEHPEVNVASLAQIAKAKVTGDRPSGTTDTTEL